MAAHNAVMSDLNNPDRFAPLFPKLRLDEIGALRLQVMIEQRDVTQPPRAFIFPGTEPPYTTEQDLYEKHGGGNFVVTALAPTGAELTTRELFLMGKPKYEIPGARRGERPRPYPADGQPDDYDQRSAYQSPYNHAPPPPPPGPTSVEFGENTMPVFPGVDPSTNMMMMMMFRLMDAKDRNAQNQIAAAADLVRQAPAQLQALEDRLKAANERADMYKRQNDELTAQMSDLRRQGDAALSDQRDKFRREIKAIEEERDSKSLLLRKAEEHIIDLERKTTMAETTYGAKVALLDAQRDLDEVNKKIAAAGAVSNDEQRRMQLMQFGIALANSELGRNFLKAFKLDGLFGMAGPADGAMPPPAAMPPT
jgi:hypothetical protein